MDRNNSNSWWRSGGACLACNQLATLSCPCPRPGVPVVQLRVEQCDDYQGDVENDDKPESLNDVSRKTSAFSVPSGVSAPSNGGRTKKASFSGWVSNDDDLGIATAAPSTEARMANATSEQSVDRQTELSGADSERALWSIEANPAGIDSRQFSHLSVVTQQSLDNHTTRHYCCQHHQRPCASNAFYSRQISDGPNVNKTTGNNMPHTCSDLDGREAPPRNGRADNKREVPAEDMFHTQHEIPMGKTFHRLSTASEIPTEETFGSSSIQYQIPERKAFHRLSTQYQTSVGESFHKLLPQQEMPTEETGRELSTKGQISTGEMCHNFGCWLHNTSQLSAVGCCKTVARNSLPQSSQPRTVEDQSLNSRHATSKCCNNQQSFFASSACCYCQHSNQPNVDEAVDDNASNSSHLCARQLSSGEISLLSAKGSNPDDNEWRRVGQSCAVGCCKTVSQESLHQSSKPIAAGKQSFNSHITKCCCNVHQWHCASSAVYSRDISHRSNVDQASNNNIPPSSHLNARQVSSSEESLLSAKGSNPYDNEWRLVSNACKSGAVGSRNIVARTSLSLPSNVEEDLLANHITHNNAKTSDKSSDTSKQTNEKQAKNAVGKRESPNDSTKKADGGPQSLDDHTKTGQEEYVSIGSANPEQVSSSESLLSTKGSNSDDNEWIQITNGCGSGAACCCDCCGTFVARKCSSLLSAKGPELKELPKCQKKTTENKSADDETEMAGNIPNSPSNSAKKTGGGYTLPDEDIQKADGTFKSPNNPTKKDGQKVNPNSANFEQVYSSKSLLSTEESDSDDNEWIQVTSNCGSGAACCCNCCGRIVAKKCSSLLSAKGSQPKELPRCQKKKAESKLTDDETEMTAGETNSSGDLAKTVSGKSTSPDKDIKKADNGSKSSHNNEKNTDGRSNSAKDSTQKDRQSDNDSSANSEQVSSSKNLLSTKRSNAYDNKWKPMTITCMSDAAYCCNCCDRVVVRKCSSLLSAKGPEPKELPRCQKKTTEGKSTDDETEMADGEFNSSDNETVIVDGRPDLSGDETEMADSWPDSPGDSTKKVDRGSKSSDKHTKKAGGELKPPDNRNARDEGKSLDTHTRKAKVRIRSQAEFESARNDAQHSNRRNANENADRASTGSSSESSLLSAGGSNADSDEWTTLTSGACWPNATGSRSTVFWDLEDLNHTCNCRHVEQIMRNHEAHNRVTKSTERLSSTVYDSRQKSRTISTPNAHDSNTGTLPMKSAADTRHSNNDSKKTEYRNADKISEITKTVPENGNFVHCCNGECRRYCGYGVASCNCEKCFMACHDWTTKNEVATYDILETQSTPSEHGSSRSTASRTATDSDVSSRAAATPCDSITSAPDDDYDADECHGALSSGNLPSDQEIAGERMICPKCHCYRSNYEETTTNDGTSYNESIAESSTEKQQLQQNFTDDVARSDARATHFQSDATCRSGTASVRDHEMCRYTSPQYDATPSPVGTQTANGCRGTCCHGQHAMAVSRSGEQGHRHDDAERYRASPTSIQAKGKSATTDVTTSAACSSSSYNDNVSDKSQSEPVDEEYRRKGCPTSGGLQCQVMIVLTASLRYV